MRGIQGFSVKKSLMQGLATAGKKKIILNTTRGITVVFVHRCAPMEEKFYGERPDRQSGPQSPAGGIGERLD